MIFTDISTLVKKAKEGDQKAQENILFQLRLFVIKQAKAVFIKAMVSFGDSITDLIMKT